MLDIVSDEETLVPIIANGLNRWKPSRDKSVLISANRSCLWDSSSGPLPLLGADYGDEATWIEDPWEGWIERRSGADPSCPFFGAGHPGVFWLNLRTYPRQRTNICGLSLFEWIGNHYKILGNAAGVETLKCWQRLRSRIAKATTKVPRGRIDAPLKPEIFAFPVAEELLRSGKKADDNP